ncbi:uncharacterized protein LACBIDRAFT_335105 [Laccaria bicolor S238N-H82]|uniref:Predicted protein n=1 Tax=Laccaria bicolor (strain S238N-H82 / ATCC MYA-4686) TaxID=486041 RepID=B0E1D6_LACBS|nr:uncharacterized protein LACBIDRAFT_335105 [Laccaria bicolor S238N-H82]EDQ99347.1 predicted protein [Laccaria bicolor S238N-H82]|eukprot:XP_001889993.1 predicted protein [Laccaria bicolor S238N-H82]
MAMALKRALTAHGEDDVARQRMCHVVHTATTHTFIAVHNGAASSESKLGSRADQPHALHQSCNRGWWIDAKEEWGAFEMREWRKEGEAVAREGASASNKRFFWLLFHVVYNV